ncbi:hypothetical protein RND71_039844 [Anisodus tanguticus]|uniref:RNase H type-1 domain-containing protein n=1 Tax=Anisodus tanguticus TaxID=243964 RepID=A0AAE1QY55_9SOLA|nr:hypothetical protein RND71_039844 [Anisodus tanguticus]
MLTHTVIPAFDIKRLQPIIFTTVDDDNLSGDAASLEIATTKNMETLVQIGNNLLQNPVSRVNLERCQYEPVHGEGTTEQSLIRFANFGTVEEGKWVRDKDGKFIMAFCIPLGRGNSNVLEAAAFLFDLNWCIQNGFNMVVGETDSLLLHNCIQDIWLSPWRIESIVSKIKFLMESNQVSTNHSFREANKVANKLASLSHTTGHTCIYTNYDTLPRQIKGLLNTDRWQLSSFRVRRRKHGAIIYDPP